MASNLTRFDPLYEMARFDPFHRFDDLFKEFGGMGGLPSLDTAQRIAMDVNENDKAYTVKAEIPGVNKEDIKIDVNGNQVTISAETRKESEQKEGESVLRSERYYGRQYRSFTLPQDVDDSGAQARYKDGVLELTLPKKGDSVSKKIAIS